MTQQPDTVPLQLNGAQYSADDEEPSHGSGSIAEQFMRAIKGAHIKSMLFLFIIFILVTSDVFTNLVLKKMGSAVENSVVTPYGVIIQGIFLVIAFILMNFLIEHDVI